MRNVIFIAPPAAGKGTQSQKLKEKYGYKHISTGNMFRNAVESKTELGLKVQDILNKGQLVSDDIVISLIKEELNKSQNNFILDGFPRTLNQAEKLTEILNDLNISNCCVIYLKVSEQTAMQRALGRLTCPKCNSIYNKYIEELKPKKLNVCDKCLVDLVARTDDNEKSFKLRFENYLKDVSAILNYYSKLHLLIEIDAEKNDNEIFCDIIKGLNEGEK